MLPIVTSQHAAEEKSRLVLINLAGLTMRLMENWRHGTAEILGRMPDYDTVMIVGAIIGIGAEKFARGNLDGELQTLANQFPSERLTKCNVSSIAAATGLKRETVRRKVNELLLEGLLARCDKGGVRLAPEVMQRPQIRQTLQAQLEAVGRAVNQLSRMHVVRHGST